MFLYGTSPIWDRTPNVNRILGQQVTPMPINKADAHEGRYAVIGVYMLYVLYGFLLVRDTDLSIGGPLPTRGKGALTVYCLAVLGFRRRVHIVDLIEAWE